jgi:hypothetical protein
MRSIGSPLRFVLALAALGAVGCDDAAPASDAGPPADGGASDGSAPLADAGEPPLGGAECAVARETLTLGSTGAVRLGVAPSCVDPRTRLLPDKLHTVTVPDAPSSPLLYVHLGGSGGQPTQHTNLTDTAAFEGMRAIGLAYPNEPSVDARCTDPETGASRGLDCEAEVRAEVVYGVDTSPHETIPVADAIVFRLWRLLGWLDAQAPDAGWAAYRDEGGIRWDRVVLSGFSQGGGHAGVIGRDHRLARVFFLSKAAGAALNYDVDEASAPSCAPDPADPTDPVLPCDRGACCPLDEPQCDTPPASDGRCLFPVPNPIADTGGDTDGDGLGDGPPSTRATPPERTFLLVHRDEPAFLYSPDVMRLFGVDALGDFADVDTASPPYGGTHLLSTGLPPRGSCSPHQSLGADGCQPRSGGLPAMVPAWRYMMTTPVP